MLVQYTDNMLIGSSEPGINRFKLTGNPYVHQMMGNKSNHNSRSFFLSEIFRGPVVLIMQKYSFQGEV